MSRFAAAAAVLSMTLSLAACHCPPMNQGHAEGKPMAMEHHEEHHVMVEVRHAEPMHEHAMAMHHEEPNCMAGCACYASEADRDMGRLRDRAKKGVCPVCGHEGCTGCQAH